MNVFLQDTGGILNRHLVAGERYQLGAEFDMKRVERRAVKRSGTTHRVNSFAGVPAVLLGDMLYATVIFGGYELLLSSTLGIECACQFLFKSRDHVSIEHVSLSG
jgi:hypothetical protein